MTNHGARFSFVGRNESRKAVLRYLKENDLPEKTFAEMLGTTPLQLGIAVGSASVSFASYRVRLQIERLMGSLLWHTAREHEELRQIGARLGVDLLTAPIPAIRKAARAAGIPIPAPSTAALAPGIDLFRALLRHFFPASETINSAPYAPLAKN